MYASQLGNEYDKNLPDWTQKEIASLLRGVMKNGENEWTDLMEDIFVH